MNVARSSPPAPPNLPAAAQAGWAAYHVMLSSKESYFNFLAALDRKAQAGEQRSLAEIAHLDALLARHTEAVGRFRSEITALTARDRVARDSLVALIGQLNQSLGAEPPSVH